MDLIQQARQRTFHAVNTELIDLYWQVGEYISRKLTTATWGEGVVDQLARYIARKHPDIKGFTRRNLFRMHQFYETYRAEPKLSPLVRELPWTHNLLILSRAKRPEEREFYLRLALQEKWPTKVAADSAYQNAKRHSDRQNARVEHDKSLARVMTSVLKDNTELFKQFSDNESFRRWLTDTIFALTYE